MDAIRTGLYTDGAQGVRLHCALAGAERLDAGQPLMLLLHGFPEYWYGWAGIMPMLAAGGRKVVAPDLRGYNLSDKPAGHKAYGIRALTADVCALIDTLGAGRCTLVAHDWGGAVAWNVAIAHPERIERLVILNAPHPWLFWHALATDPAQQAASAYMNWLRAEGSEGRLAENDFRRLERLFTGFGATPWFDDRARHAYHEAWSQPGALTGGVNYYRASPLHPPAEGAPGAAGIELDPAEFRVTVPTQVIWGMQDQALLPSLIDGLERFVPQLTIHRLPEASHWLVHEAPDTVAGLIRDFCRNGA